MVCKSLLEKNIDSELLDPTWVLRSVIDDYSDNVSWLPPISVLSLKWIIEIVTSKRLPEIKNNLVAPYKKLFKFHAEIILKLTSNWQKMSDFFKEQWKELSKAVAFLRSVYWYTQIFWKITPKQISVSLSTFQEYKWAMQTMIDNDEEFATIATEKCVRKSWDVDSATLELTIRLDDQWKWKTKLKIAQAWGITKFQIINSIIWILNPAIGKKNYSADYGHMQLPEWKEAISIYLKKDQEERSKIKDDAYEAVSQNHTWRKEIIDEFFEILDQYI